MMVRSGLVLLFALGGCGPGTGTQHPTNHPDGGGGGSALTSIEVTPASVSLVTNGGGAAAAQQFVATGHFADGHTEDLSAAAAWAISDPGMGVVTAGAFAGAASRGGVATVYAGQGSLSGSATVTVKYVATRVSTDGGSTAPPGSPGLFTGTDDPTLAPPLAYPLDGALVPHNLGMLEVQWKKPAGAADLFEVSFASPTIDYKVYTNALVPAGGKLSLSPADWSSIADSCQGQTVAVKVRGVITAQPGKVGSSAAAMISVGQGDVSGGIYYFAPISATGQQIGAVMRHSFGDTSGTASQFYAPSNGTRCVGCHVITHDGTKMAATFDGGNGNATIVSVPLLATMLPETSGDKWNFASYSPDGNRMVATSQGTLKILDTSGGAQNGTVQQTIADGTAGHYASHPDWSADGTKIVYVDVGVPNGKSEWSFSGGSIVVVSDIGMGMFGNPQKIVTTTAGVNNYYPSFSPDGKWVLFNRGSNAAYNDETAEAWVVSSDGTVGPIALGNANSTAVKPTNSWPRWNPFVVHESGGDLMYFTFSSTRDYGIELVGANQPQIWMAAFEPAKATANMDPSSSAFWMPFQDVKSHNHIAQWTATFIP